MVGADRGSFLGRLQLRAASLGGSLCVGLDPVANELPEHLGRGPEAVRRYCLELIDATEEYACAFKPNAAFFEAMGPPGWAILAEVVAAARRRALVVLDAKRGDIGHTAEAYANAVFDQLGADGCTVSGYLGYDSTEPFLRRPDRLAFVLCRTSNPGAGDLQDLPVGERRRPLYLEVARLARSWSERESTPRVGLVTGATWPQEMAQIREEAPGLPFLIPGVGAQGGDLDAAVAAARGPDGSGPYLLSVSRGIGGVSRGLDFAQAAAAAARGYLNGIRSAMAASQPRQETPQTSTL
ncbi:MAG: orotidine-5'-phosphate decarboxylase [Candidatus Dormibacteria bacterium]